MSKKILDLFFAGLIMSVAWTLRGQFGHLKGAMIPGAAAAILIALFGRDASWRTAFGRSAILGAFGFSLGGHFSYGKLIENIIASPELDSILLLRIFLIGSLWGGLGATFLGFGFSEKPIRFSDFIFFIFLGTLWFIPLGIMNLEHLDLFLYAAGFVILHSYNLIAKKSLNVFLFGFSGYLGFGAGFLISVLVLWLGGRGFFGSLSFWVFRDQYWGFWGGVSIYLAVRILERLESLPEKWYGLMDLEKMGYIFLTVFIPAFLTFHVVLYWMKLQTSFLTAIEFAAGITAVSIFFFLLWIVESRLEKHLPFQRDRAFILAVFFFFGYLSLLAIVKEVAVFGRERWETAYTIFLVSTAALTVFIPFKIHNHLKRSS